MIVSPSIAVGRRKIQSFLSLSGNVSGWVTAILAALFAFGLAERVFTGPGLDAVYFYAVLFPIFCGTGLLASAQEGKFDLLLGSGVSRSAIWTHAVTRSVLVPALAGIVLGGIQASDPVRVVATACGVLLCTGGVAFAGGLLRPRYVVGVVWIATRLTFLLSKPGTEAVAYFGGSKLGLSPPTPSLTALALIAIPEILLERPGLPALPVVAGLIGIGALLVSRLAFLKADFAGKRKE